MTNQFPLPLPHREAMGDDDFRVTDSNRDAIAWIDKWPAWPAHCLIIHGPSGSGKTHLAQVWLKRSRGKPVTIDQLTTEDIQDTRLALDNADKIAGDAAAEEALFHLFNRLKDQKGFLLLTAQKAPANWGLKLPDLQSRLNAAQAAPLTSPDDELLSALLIKQFRDRQIDINLDVVDYLIPRLERTPDAIRKIVTALDRNSLAEKRGITIALARRILEEAEQTSPSPADI